MQIILLERVNKLGQIGDIVEVKNGYARNFLLPQKKALRATAANKAIFEAQRKEIEANNLKAKTEAEAVAAKMDDVSVVLIRQAGESGQLFGSVTARDIAVAVEEAGFKVGKNQVILDRAIKVLGLNDIVVRLHAEVDVTVTVNVARSAEEAEIQAAGGDVNAEEEEAEISVEDYFENEEDAEAAATGDEAEEEAPAEEAAAEEEAPAEDAEEEKAE
ncbi:50S ribosomal protein L9 [Pseudemcibacter aquimaris]|uniref:50S ribosomal protein L9 n=1 Tax=Pseudemcibacter aquimaris TaxID=2857064 RepID=UPI0020113CFD|nr:50S ribosomal protein L9 [Pseudemcibacter aquimaris]MCC3859977.1 50S ribosomal protein L9 [Pseudemcibacter aquimaris]WDU57309.1 50S ribosomal protein L9 [Pseudemcibacter aquimaris]